LKSLASANYAMQKKRILKAKRETLKNLLFLNILP
jgi:hypothetical protein